MSRDERDRMAAFEAHHAAIIARTLHWADSAAARGDYTEAVHWVKTLDDLGHELSAEYAVKRDTWLNAIERDPPTRD
ncbi:MAG TPA: hypothetical protein VMB27_07105 [Solirubrobacteraceae bacterium]|nr:hypothetical protein [Solirubrobacteraceae bacterium]